MADRPNIEKYKTAIHSTAKAIARSSFGEKREKFDKISKPKILSAENNEEILEARVLSDSEALKIKYSDDNILNKNQPNGTIGRMIYNIAEKIRYEKIIYVVNLFNGSINFILIYTQYFDNPNIFILLYHDSGIGFFLHFLDDFTPWTNHSTYEFIRNFKAYHLRCMCFYAFVWLSYGFHKFL